MSAHIGTNFSLESKEFLDSRQNLALTEKDLLEWRTPVPEGFKVCLDKKWYYYDSTVNLEKTGHWIPCVVDNISDALYDGQTVSAKVVKEMKTSSEGNNKELGDKLSQIEYLVNPIVVSHEKYTYSPISELIMNSILDVDKHMGEKAEGWYKFIDLNNDGVIDEKDKTLWTKFYEGYKKIEDDPTYYSTSDEKNLTYEVGHMVSPYLMLKLRRKSGSTAEGVKDLTFATSGLNVQLGLTTGLNSILCNKMFTSSVPADFKISLNLHTISDHKVPYDIVYRFRCRKFVGSSDLLDLSGGIIKSSAINSKLTSSFAESGTIDKTILDCSGGRYPYIIIPAQYYNPNNKLYVGGFLNTDLVVEDVVIENKVGVQAPYKVIRTRLKQTGSSIPVQLTSL